MATHRIATPVKKMKLRRQVIPMLTKMCIALMRFVNIIMEFYALIWKAANY
jgi:hypothetical protein